MNAPKAKNTFALSSGRVMGLDERISQLVERLEEIARRHDCGSEPNYLEAKQVKADLFSACETDPTLSYLRPRGTVAFKHIVGMRSAIVEQHRRERAENLQLKRRIIAAIHAAASSDDPSRFLEEIREVRQLFRTTGSAGPENAAVAADFQAANAAFRSAIEAKKRALG